MENCDVSRDEELVPLRGIVRNAMDVAGLSTDGPVHAQENDIVESHGISPPPALILEGSTLW